MRTTIYLTKCLCIFVALLGLWACGGGGGTGADPLPETNDVISETADALEVATDAGCAVPAPAGCPCDSDDDCQSGACGGMPGFRVCAKTCSGASDCDPFETCVVEQGKGVCRSVFATACLPCKGDGDCRSIYKETCAPMPQGHFCLPVCEGPSGCPRPFECVDSLCVPVGGAPCPCTEEAAKVGVKDLGDCKDYFTDKDMDGHGSPTDHACLCGPFEPFVAEAGDDCDDADPNTHPGGKELCDNKDQDCDGTTDNDVDPAEASCNTKGVCGAHPDKVIATCKGGQWSCSFTAVPGYEGQAEQSCDGLDNDCDGKTDEDFSLSAGGVVLRLSDPCGVGICGGGVVVCAENHAGVVCSTDKLAHAELCNSMDDDCDGLTDEDFTWQGIPVRGPSGQFYTCAGVGACAAFEGVVECAPSGLVAVCSTAPGGSDSRAQAEDCNGVDDDCDGLTDEDLLDPSQGECLHKGVCEAAVAVCANGAWECRYDNLPDYEPGVEQSCDGKDNDCDGETDEDFFLPNTNKKVGDPCGFGVCAGGVVVCSQDGKGAMCSTAQLATIELCDGLDNDCDGLTDEDFTYQGSPVWLDPANTSKGHGACRGIGECSRVLGFVECGPEGARCSTNPGGSEHLDKPETCDGLDEDCDGETDEGLTDPKVSTCSLYGVCAFGIQYIKAVCILGIWNCDYSQVPGWEGAVEKSCDGVDNDCDGQTDEDFALLDHDGKLKKVGDTCGTGACAGGKVVCADVPQKVQCSSLGLAKVETCDGTDEDCDGKIDNGILWNGIPVGGACKGKGLCGTVSGKVECDPKTKKARCSVEPGGSESPARPEVCNGIDDDCDGTTDEAEEVNCDDKDACTQDVCKGGICQNIPITCSDNNPCTDDACNKATGCVFKPNTLPCDDHDECTVGDVCKDGECKGIAVRSCDDNNPCTKDACEPSGGCIYTYVQDPCDDGNPCTTGDRCSNGVCKSGPPTDCDDRDKCTRDWCDSKIGCMHEHTDSPCDDGLACTLDKCEADSCSNEILAGFCVIDGVCVAEGALDRPGGCRVCSPQDSQTTWTPLKDGTRCNADGNGCTVGDECKGGTCNAGPPPDCSGLDSQCGRGVCVSKGQDAFECVLNPFVGQPCNDNNLCTRDDTCDISGACRGVPYSCSDGYACTDDQCNGKGGCVFPVLPGFCLVPSGTGKTCVESSTVHPSNVCLWCDPAKNARDWSSRPDGTQCDDNDPCTLSDACASGQCKGTPKVCAEPNPVCIGGTCQCADKVTCDPTLSDNCVAGTCKCGTGPACGAPSSDRCVQGKCQCGPNLPACGGADPDCYKSTACVCGQSTCAPRGDTCIAGECRCGNGPKCSTGLVCCGGQCKLSC